MSPTNAKAYTIQNYSSQRPFSSFLPGVAGHLGVPMWVFYVNRGQGVTSFGVESKDNPIMEFQSANKAYQRTAREGFRTFVKWKKASETGFYEPFSDDRAAEQSMSIGMSELMLTDENPALGLKADLLYFTIPGENFAALARQVTLTNTSGAPLELEILDGIPALIPFGIDNGGLKHVGRTLEAWMQVFHHESGLPFFRLGATPGDTAEVHEIKAGHFAFSFTAKADKTEKLPAFVDPQIVFGANTSFSSPNNFIDRSFAALQAETQVVVGKTPCAFFGQKAALLPGEQITLYSLFGHVNGYENIAENHQRLSSAAYFAAKREENRTLIESLTDIVATKTGEPLFDAYVRQTFLDNVLRGGFPLMLGAGEKPHAYHVYSRKHGDPERDYNHFFLAAEFYSQGNGNFRDVCQNRRSDVLLEPRLRDHNIRTFLSLIQLDGYNPLVIRGMSFSITPEQKADLLALVSSVDPGLVSLLDQRFTPGALLKYIADHRIEIKVSYSEFLAHALRDAAPHLEADYGEGFWVDHWTYILDLVENYLAVYPDCKKDLLFGEAVIPFFRSPAQVRPRHERYVLTERGARQYDAVTHAGSSGWALGAEGTIYRITPFGKLLLLAATKFGTLDAEGMGVEMEAGKPGWYDALNGLPGIFASSMNETYELLRLVRFLCEALAELEEPGSVLLPVEFGHYLQGLVTLSRSGASRFDWWAQANNLRESYREQVYRPSLSGDQMAFAYAEVLDILNIFARYLEDGITRAQALAVDDVPPAYFRYEAVEYDILNAGERPNIRVKKFEPTALPPFLEGAVRALKVHENAAEIHGAVRKSGLFDRALGMYKVNASLNGEPHEIGRARAFTPGWLENESIWLHMEYKYLLGLLKAGLYDAFFDDFKNALIPFQPAARYGRSPLENSSFIVSSAHPDASLHGTGFVARLSGATAEFVEMWTIMMAGKQPFVMRDGELVLRLSPIIPAWLFDENDEVRFNFLGKIPVTYRNTQRANTWAIKPTKIVLRLNDAEQVEFNAAYIPAPYAALVREEKVRSIHIYLG